MKRHLTSSLAPVFSALGLVAALTVMSGMQSARAEDAATSPAQPAPAQQMFGAIAGVVRTSAKAPVVGAMVTASRTDGKGIWTTISGTDGIYSIPNIAPGEYQVTTQAEGYPDLTVSALQVAAGRATRTDIALVLNVPAQPTVISANAPAADVPPATPAQPAPAPSNVAGNAASNSVQSIWQRLLRKSPTNAPEPVNTASLIPPVSAFDRRADTADSPFPSVPSPQGPAATPAPQGSTAQGAPVAPPAPEVDLITPFADYDWTWLNGNPRNHDVAFDSKFFTPEIRADLTYTYDFNKPSDNSMGGSSELFRSNEIQLEQLGIGGDFHWDNARARFMTQFGEYSEATIRNDGSYNKGQWNLNDADRYLVGSLRRVARQLAARNQLRRGHLHVLRRVVQLLQLR